MIIFLRNIPLDTKKFELVGFLTPIFGKCFLGDPTTNISVEDIDFLSIQDVDSNAMEKHGLVRVFPNEVGKRLIKNLDGKFFKQQPVAAREYVIRSASNDPRNHSKEPPAGMTDRRIADRRRPHIMNSWQNNPILVHTSLVPSAANY